MLVRHATILELNAESYRIAQAKQKQTGGEPVKKEMEKGNSN